MTNYDMVLEFDRDGSDFVHGVEVGMLYRELLDTTEEVIRDRQIRRCNEEMAIRIARATGFNIHVVCTEPASDWLFASFYRKQAEATA